MNPNVFVLAEIEFLANERKRLAEENHRLYAEIEQLKKQEKEMLQHWEEEKK